MKIKCRTNLDLYYESFPSELPCVPRIGEYIQSATTHKNGFKLHLQVCNITWKKADAISWIPEIELIYPQHKTQSLREFYEWYAPLVGKSVSAFI